jgi:hypothetical protein
MIEEGLDAKKWVFYPLALQHSVYEKTVFEQSLLTKFSNYHSLEMEVQPPLMRFVQHQMDFS